MNIYKCGIIVKAKIGNIEGMITCQNIRFGKVTYEITYLHGGEYKTCWMNEKEFSTEYNPVEKIGFRKT